MNLVDSCGWLEYFADGPNARFFAAHVEDTAKLVVPSICIYEVFRRLLQEGDRSAALEAIAVMRQGRVIPLTSAIAVEAATIGREMRLPMADSIILATARANNAVVWTQDGDFQFVAGVRYIPRKG
jgi:predicted nucleic acid-binding protein